MAPKDQAKTLRDLVGIDFSDLDNQRKGLFDDRTLINRQVKMAEGALANAPQHPGAPASEVSVGDASKELQETISANAAIDAKAQYREQAKKNVTRIEGEIADLMDRVSDLRAQLDSSKAISSDETPLVKSDIAPIQAKIQNAEQINRQVRENANRAKLKAQLDEQISKSSDLSNQLDQIDRVKTEMLAEAKFPVAGLSFNDDGVLLNGLPFEQASGAEQLRTSVAMGLAINPKLNILLVRDGSLLDANSLKILTEMVELADGQLWLEKVSQGAECSVIIEDGMVKKSVEPQAVLA